MFYLNQLGKIFLKAPIQGASFFILTLMMTVGITQKDYVEKIVFKSIPNQNQGAHFHALISGKENYFRVSRKLEALPGVWGVKVLEKTQIESQVKSILGSLSTGLAASMLDLDYAGVKVIFKRGLQSRSQQLIKDYLQRLVGTSKITLGSTKSDSEMEKSRTAFFDIFKSWGVAIFTIIVAVAWLVSFFLFSNKIKETAYILERFQRKDNIALKIYLVACSVLIGVSLILNLSFGAPSFLIMLITAGVVFAGSLMQVKKYQWQN
jgi:hypothetical protein